MNSAHAAGENRRPQYQALAQGALEIGRQLRYAHDESQRLQVLLDEAIGVLMSSFDGLDALAQRQEAWAASCPVAPADFAAPAVRDAATLDEFTTELRRHVGAAVVALQFHDMAGQLCGHVRRHIDQARNLSSGLHALAAPPPASTSAPARHELLDPAPWHALTGLVAASQRNTLSSPVARAQITAGDVEMFQQHTKEI